MFPLLMEITIPSLQTAQMKGKPSENEWLRSWYCILNVLRMLCFISLSFLVPFGHQIAVTVLLVCDSWHKAAALQMGPGGTSVPLYPQLSGLVS